MTIANLQALYAAYSAATSPAALPGDPFVLTSQISPLPIVKGGLGNITGDASALSATLPRTGITKQFPQWLTQFSRIINLRDEFGTDGPSIQAAITRAIAEKACIWVPPGFDYDYVTEPVISGSGNVAIFADRGTARFRQLTYGYSGLRIDTADMVKVSGLIFENPTTKTGINGTYNGLPRRERSSGIFVTEANFTLIEDCTFINYIVCVSLSCRADLNTTTLYRGNTVKGCTFRGHDFGVLAVCQSSATFENNKGYDTTRTQGIDPHMIYFSGNYLQPRSQVTLIGNVETNNVYSSSFKLRDCEDSLLIGNRSYFTARSVEFDTCFRSLVSGHVALVGANTTDSQASAIVLSGTQYCKVDGGLIQIADNVDNVCGVLVGSGATGDSIRGLFVDYSQTSAAGNQCAFRVGTATNTLFEDCRSLQRGADRPHYRDDGVGTQIIRPRIEHATATNVSAINRSLVSSNGRSLIDPALLTLTQSAATLVDAGTNNKLHYTGSVLRPEPQTVAAIPSPSLYPAMTIMPVMDGADGQPCLAVQVNGAWQRIALGTAIAGAPTFTAQNAETTALLARMPTQPSDAYKTAMDAHIGRLKAAGVWALTDVLYEFAATAQGNALINWMGSSFTPVAYGAPAFAALQGFSGNAASAYLDTTYVPGQGQFQQDNHAFDIDFVSTSTSQRIEVGNTQYQIGCAAGPVAGIKDSSTTSDNSTFAYTTDIFLVNRTASAGYSLFRGSDGSSQAFTRASVAPSALSLFLLAANAGGTASTFSGRRVRSFRAGAGLTGAQISAYVASRKQFYADIGAS